MPTSSGNNYNPGCLKEKWAFGGELSKLQINIKIFNLWGVSALK